MRWLYAILILLWVPSALADVGNSELARPKTQSDPCWTASETSARSAPPVWAAKLRRRTAIYVIQHVRKACRIMSDATDSGDERLAQLLAQLRDDVLGPIYCAYPRLAHDPLADDSRRPEYARATGKDIGRATAVRLEAALTKIRGEIGQGAPDKANQAANKDVAEAALQPFLNATVELSLASQVVFDAYPDLRTKEFRSVQSQPRSAETDASYRKMVPPLGSVRLSASALQQVKMFMRQVRHDSPQDDWIATILWATKRKYRGPNDLDWINVEDGLELGAYHRTDVPSDVIDKVDGAEIVFSAPDPSMLAGKTIDLQKGQLVLRN
jgi:hypothetical protein